MISVSCDHKAIMLCERAQDQSGTWLWIGVEDANVLFAEYSAKEYAFESRHRTSAGLRVLGRGSGRSRAALRVRAQGLTA